MPYDEFMNRMNNPEKFERFDCSVNFTAPSQLSWFDDDIEDGCGTDDLSQYTITDNDVAFLSSCGWSATANA